MAVLMSNFSLPSYDFGYLLKTLTCTDLPMDEPAFLELLLTYFPCIYDVKVHTRTCTHLSHTLIQYIHTYST